MIPLPPPSNDLLFQPPPRATALRLTTGLPDPVHATLTLHGAATDLLCVPLGRNWVTNLCRALVAAGVDPQRGVIVREWDRQTVTTVLCIADTLAVVDRPVRVPAQTWLDLT